MVTRETDSISFLPFVRLVRVKHFVEDHDFVSVDAAISTSLFFFVCKLVCLFLLMLMSSRPKLGTHGNEKRKKTIVVNISMYGSRAWSIF